MHDANQPKVRATLYLPQDVIDEARDAAVFLAGYPARLTLTKLAENAFRAELRRLKQLYNEGRDFPRRDEELRRRPSHCRMKGTVVMDLHPDAVLPQVKSPQSSRIDASTRDDEAKVAHLRARLLKMIVANEKSRKASEEKTRPR